MLSLIFFAITIFCKFKVLYSQNNTLIAIKHLEILSQHGDKIPIVSNSTESLQEFLDRLMHENLNHYELGKSLREIYRGSTTLDPNEAQKRLKAMYQIEEFLRRFHKIENDVNNSDEEITKQEDKETGESVDQVVGEIPES